MTREELVEAMAKDVSAAVHIKGSPCVMCYGVANHMLATHAAAIIRLAVEGYMAGTGKPGAHGVTLYLTEELLADGLVRAWERGKTT